MRTLHPHVIKLQNTIGYNAARTRFSQTPSAKAKALPKPVGRPPVSKKHLKDPQRALRREKEAARKAAEAEAEAVRAPRDQDHASDFEEEEEEEEEEGAEEGGSGGVEEEEGAGSAEMEVEQPEEEEQAGGTPLQEMKLLIVLFSLVPPPSKTPPPAMGVVDVLEKDTCQAGATSPAGLYVCRGFVGIGQAMFGQAIAFYRPHFKIPQWRILFLIEGIPSCAHLRHRGLLLSPRSTSRLQVSERGGTSHRSHLTQLEELAVIRAFTDWKTYAVSIAYSCMDLGLGSVSAYLPTIIKGLGYTNAEAQLYTIPPCAVSLIFMLMVTTTSDRYQQQAIPGPSFSASFLYEQRRELFVLGTSDASASSLLDTPTFLSPSLVLNTIEQFFIKGASINVAFQGFGFFITLNIYYRTENNRRDGREGGRPAPRTKIDVVNDDDSAVGFRYTP
ncbi:hypothetical protein BDY24DRAFT_445432 [Mrakia frigida]|uniref:uncharacterized protein n=1 Tax=Mrakia frigida TaxID=29902 RepID=UPI003FCBEFED